MFFDLAYNLLLGHFNFNTLFHWLQELLDAEFIPIPDDSQDCIDPLTKPYTESATLPYEELDQLKATGKSLMVLRLHSGGGVSSWVGGASLMTRVVCLFCSQWHAWITSGWTVWRRDAPSRAAAARASSWQTYASHIWHAAKHYTALAQVWNEVILIDENNWHGCNNSTY